MLRQAFILPDQSGSYEPKGLVVVAQQVVPIEAGSADGRLMVEAGMWSVPVVVVQP